MQDQEFPREDGTGFADDADRTARMSDLTVAADRLREATAALTQAMVRGSPIERAEARDRFDLALAAFSALIDETRE